MTTIMEKIYVDDKALLRVKGLVSIKAKKNRIQTVTSANTSGT